MRQVVVIGIVVEELPIFRISCSFCMQWMIEPAERNRVALNVAWVAI